MLDFSLQFLQALWPVHVAAICDCASGSDRTVLSPAALVVGFRNSVARRNPGRTPRELGYTRPDDDLVHHGRHRYLRVLRRSSTPLRRDRCVWAEGRLARRHSRRRKRSCRACPHADRPVDPAVRPLHQWRLFMNGSPREMPEWRCSFTDAATYYVVAHPRGSHHEKSSSLGSGRASGGS